MSKHRVEWYPLPKLGFQDFEGGTPKRKRRKGRGLQNKPPVPDEGPSVSVHAFQGGSPGTGKRA